ncbi:C-4 methylsterol oxidase [Aureococcus anophagefferens]|nr:C-4 methylsterol oxidase [Aureococcus anophagefferens]
MLYRTKDQGGASRKYEPDSWPTAGNMAHNLWYWSLGVAQWTFWECAMCRIWEPAARTSRRTRRFSEITLLLKNAAVLLLVPVWRDFHFYVAHRFLHVRACYKYVHGLHHRNADPEPFSGMCMHPVEHLYYFSNAFFPTLLVDGLSPLVFLWVFVHLSIAPGAGHSGFEDHFQADQYHYLHHRKFECNYGSPSSAFLDQFFGTFREKLGKSGARSAFDVLSDGPLEHVLTFLDCKALCVSKVAMRDFLTVTAHPRFVARLKRLRGFDDAPMAPMVDARERSFHLDTAALATTVERVAVFEELRALERNHVAFHLATLTPTPDPRARRQDDDTDELPESDDDDDEDEDDSVGGGHVHASDSDGDDTGGSSEEEEDDDGEAPAYEPLLEEAA